MQATKHKQLLRTNFIYDNNQFLKKHISKNPFICDVLKSASFACAKRK